MFRKKIAPLHAFIGLIILVVWCFPIGPARSEETPTISLVQTIIVRDYKGLKVSSDVYTVKADDNLTRVLKQRGVINRLFLDKETRRMIMTFNPGLKNPDLIRPGQKLVLPVAQVKELASLSIKTPDTPAGESPGYRVQRVARGNSLYLFLKQEGFSDEDIIGQYLDQCLSLNPQIKDPDLIFPGQMVKVPVQGSGRGEPGGANALALEEKQPEAKAAAGRTETLPEKKPATDKTIGVPPAPNLPEEQTLAMRTALGLIFTRLGEQFLSTGQHFLPLKTGDQITLNAAAFPIIKLRNGHRIILDVGGRLPDRMIRLIKENYPDYSVFQSQRGQTVKDTLAALFKMCNYHQVLDNGRPFMFQQAFQFKLAADWIIFPVEKNLSEKRPILLNLPGDRSHGTYPAAAAFLNEFGINVIDFFPQGNIIGPGLTFKPAGPENSVETITAADLTEFMKALLDILGQKYSAGLSIPLVNGSARDKDFNLSVNAQIYFHRNGSDYLVRLQDLPDDIIKSLKAQNAEAIFIKPEEGALAAARTLANVLALSPKNDYTLKGSSRPDDRNIEFILPGLTLKTGDRPLFLTPVDIPPPLVSLLAEKNVRIIKFSIVSQ